MALRHLDSVQVGMLKQGPESVCLGAQASPGETGLTAARRKEGGPEEAGGTALVLLFDQGCFLG